MMETAAVIKIFKLFKPKWFWFVFYWLFKNKEFNSVHNNITHREIYTFWPEIKDKSNKFYSFVKQDMSKIENRKNLVHAITHLPLTTGQPADTTMFAELRKCGNEDVVLAVDFIVSWIPDPRKLERMLLEDDRTLNIFFDDNLERVKKAARCLKIIRDKTSELKKIYRRIL